MVDRSVFTEKERETIERLLRTLEMALKDRKYVKEVNDLTKLSSENVFQAVNEETKNKENDLKKVRKR